MTDIINKLLGNEILQWLVVALVLVNAALSSLAGALKLVGKVGPAWVQPAVAILQKIVDFLSANIKH